MEKLDPRCVAATEAFWASSDEVVILMAAHRHDVGLGVWLRYTAYLTAERSWRRFRGDLGSDEWIARHDDAEEKARRLRDALIADADRLPEALANAARTWADVDAEREAALAAA